MYHKMPSAKFMEAQTTCVLIFSKKFIRPTKVSKHMPKYVKYQFIILWNIFMNGTPVFNMTQDLCYDKIPSAKFMEASEHLRINFLIFIRPTKISNIR